MDITDAERDRVMNNHRARCNLITGFIGAGKTTTISGLLAARPARERWAVLLNEFGAAAIDAATLAAAGGSVVVKELAGGCMCCAAQVTLRVELTRLLRETRPDRLLVEPISSGHIGGIIALLRAPELSNALELRATLCVVDPDQFARIDIGERDEYREQISLADVIIINKCDLAAGEHIAAVRAFAHGLNPPPPQVIETRQGKIAAALLDATR